MTSISNFTNATGFAPTPRGTPEPWMTTEAFRWLFVHGDPAQGEIIVPSGFCFDGASVPVPLTLIFPRVHPAYMQSAALHDFCLTHERHRLTRAHIDGIFKEALRAQKNPAWRVNGMVAGVSAWGKMSEGPGYYRLSV